MESQHTHVSAMLIYYITFLIKGICHTYTVNSDWNFELPTFKLSAFDKVEYKLTVKLFMEECFSHRIKIKRLMHVHMSDCISHNCKFISHNSDFFPPTVANLYLRILTIVSLKCIFISHKSDLFNAVSLYLTILNLFSELQVFFFFLLSDISHNCEKKKV